MFDLASFQQHVRTSHLGRRFWLFHCLPSTSGWLQKTPGSRLSHGLVCLADNQTRGKGQFGRTWITEPGANLTFTLVIKPRTNSAIQLHSMVVMLALKQAIEELCTLQCCIKWPNDLHIGGKKVAGLLTECRYNGRELDRMLLGLGVNVNQERFDHELTSGATSLLAVSGGTAVDRPWLLATFLNKLEPLLSRARNPDKPLLDAINQSIIGYGKWVTISVDADQSGSKAKILGIDQNGYLVVLTGDDVVRVFRHEQVRIIL